MNNYPLVSVIVPTKNSSHFLEACLKSITGQTYQNIELIVVDNYSTDETPHLARQYTDKFFTRGPERSAQRNYGVKQSKGSYVLLIDSDMELTKNVVKACVETAAGNDSINGIVIPEESFGEGYWAQCKKLERSFYIGIEWIEAARFFLREAYLDENGYDESLVSGEDWDLSQRTAQRGPLSRVSEVIRHNEGRLKLLSYLRKKYYYASQLTKYTAKWKHLQNIKKQTGILPRYKLLLSKPKQLFKTPTVGLGVLVLKTSEFVVSGAGYLWAKYRRNTGANFHAI